MKFNLKYVFVVALLFTSSFSNANTITYDYLGGDFFSYGVYDKNTGTVVTSSSLPPNLGLRITGSVTFENGINNPATSYYLSDGITTFDSSMNLDTFASFQFNNDQIVGWNVYLNEYPAENSTAKSLYTRNNLYDMAIYTKFDGVETSIYNTARGNPGVWTLRQEQVSAVPLPGALALFSGAFGLFGLLSLRRKS